MLCDHLLRAEAAIRSGGAHEVYRGQPWTDNCREWVYFDAEIPVERFEAEGLYDPAVVTIHANVDQRSGTEMGLVCSVHHDAVMGHLPADWPR